MIQDEREKSRAECDCDCGDGACERQAKAGERVCAGGDINGKAGKAGRGGGEGAEGAAV